MATGHRQSNFELLRIVSMLMVLGVHIDGASLGMPDVSGGWSALSVRDYWQLIVEAVCIVGVNCFTMISGWFGIRLKWRGLASFLFECVFYSVLICTAVMIVKPEARSVVGWLESWLVLSHTELWYVPAYFGLMLLSPLLNAGMEALTKRRLLMIVAVFVLFNVWCGWWWGGAFNPTGYTVIQLVMVYMIARYLRLHVGREAMAAKRRLILSVYFVSLVGVVVSAFYLPGQAYAYNSPLVLINAVSLFMLFACMDFRSKIVNRLAAGAFAVYLIHKAPPVWGGLIKPSVARLWVMLPLWQFTICAVGLAVGIYFGSWMIDRVRAAFSRRLIG